MRINQVNKLIVALALAAVALISLILVLSTQSTRAQSPDQIYVDKQLGRADSVVHVGEYLTFTILIRNDAAFTVTTLPLSDTYNATVLAYADAVPPPDSVDTGAGRLDWNDLTASFGDLAPGQQILVLVGFIAEHPAAAVVNAAEVHDAIGSSGALSGTTSIITDAQSVGGSSPVGKRLPADLIPRVGLPLTFTILITNDGFAPMTSAPLVDTYNPALLRFSYAVPPPDRVNAASGVLTWTDVTSWTGDIPAHGTISVTTVFTALAAVDNASNRAQVSGARDWYGNDLTEGNDEVPITIIEGPQPTPAPTATPLPGPTATPGPAPTPLPAPPTTVPAATSQPAPPPVHLPTSGQAADAVNTRLLGAALLCGTGITALIAVLRRKPA